MGHVAIIAWHGWAGLERLSLASTAIGDAAVDYLTYYTRFPDAGPATMGVHGLRWLELSNTRVTDAGVGKLVAVIEDGTPYGKASSKSLAVQTRGTLSYSRGRPPGSPMAGVQRIGVPCAFLDAVRDAIRCAASAYKVWF